VRAVRRDKICAELVEEGPEGSIPRVGMRYRREGAADGKFSQPKEEVLADVIHALEERIGATSEERRKWCKHKSCDD
jgi:hypothetical protein